MNVINKHEVGKIKGFYETSFVDWFGRISSVFFLSGCNLRCPYCHNHDLVLGTEALPTIHRRWIAERLSNFKGWIDGVVVSGGEPCLFSQLPQLLAFFRNLSFPIKLDTNGTKPDMLAHVIEENLIDYVAMDLKAPLDDIRYSRCVGVPVSVSNIQKSLAILAESKIEYELRMTVCPSLIKKKDIYDLAKQLKNIPKFVLQYFDPKNPLDPDLKEISAYSEEEMDEFKGTLEKYAECEVRIQ